MKHQPFTFEQVEGKWIPEINQHFLFEMYTVYGIPPEISIDEIKSWTPQERLIAAIKSWGVFSKNNNIDVDKFRKELYENKDSVIDEIEKILKSHETK